MPPQERLALRYLFGMNLSYMGQSSLFVSFNSIILPLGIQALVPVSQESLVVGVVGSLGLGIATLANIFSGILSDHTQISWGRRRPYILMGAAITWPTLLVEAFYQNSIYIVALGYLVMVVSISFSFGSYQPLISDIVPVRQRSLCATIQVLFSIVGSAAGYLIVAYLSGGVIQTAIIMITGLLIASMSIPLVLLHGLDVPIQSQPTQGAGKSFVDVFRPSRLSGGLGNLITTGFLVAVGAGSLSFFSAYYFETILHFPDPVASLALAGLVTLTVTAISNVAFLPFVKKITSGRAMVLVIGLAGALNLTYPFLPSFLGYLVVSSAGGVIFALFFSSYIGLASRSAPDQGSGKHMAYANLPLGLGFAFSPVVAGSLIALFGGPSTMSGFIGLFITTSLILFAAIVPMRRQSRQMADSPLKG